MSLRADASTMFLTMNLLMALSLGMAFPVETHLTRLTCPRPFLFLPWHRRLTVMVSRRVGAWWGGREEATWVFSSHTTIPCLG